MTRARRGPLPLAALALVVLAGCEPTTPPTVTPPEQQAQSFSSTLTVNGALTHRFVTTASGEITVTLKSLSPAGTPPIAIALGVWTGASCNLVIADQNAAVNSRVVGTGTAAGEFCARVSDAGRLTAPADYTVDVTYF